MEVDWRQNFETASDEQPRDETDYSLRAYVSALSDERLDGYDPAWTDEDVIQWDGNFRSDGALMLVCCERDVDVHGFRQVVEECLRFRSSAGRETGIGSH